MTLAKYSVDLIIFSSIGKKKKMAKDEIVMEAEGEPAQLLG